MAAMRGPRLQVGSAAWIAEERSSSLQIVDQEVDEFSYSARNELEWLNEHMASIFNENEINFAETFKTPGKLRSKTPGTIRKQNPQESRMPLSDVFTATPNGPKAQPSSQVNRFKSPQLHALSRPSPLGIKPASPRRVAIFSPKAHEPIHAPQDSGYYGSQDNNAMDGYGHPDPEKTPRIAYDPPALSTSTPLRLSPSRSVARESPERTIQVANQDQVARAFATSSQAHDEESSGESDEEENDVDDYVESYTPLHSPTLNMQVDENSDEMRSPSEASSPIRPLGRKSSLNFASLPAREPLAAGKSNGGRTSRTSCLDNGNNRTSYYQRATGGKSLGNLAKHDSLYDDDQDMMDAEEILAEESEKQPLNHTKTYTQRLQDQITMLGKSQSSGGQTKPAPVPTTQHNTATPKSSPQKEPVATTTTPGAFPEDDDDWIDPPKTVEEVQESRPALSKSFTADIMEGIHSKDTIGQSEFTIPKTRQDGRGVSPQRAPAAMKGFHNLLGHGKSSSVATMPTSSLLLSSDNLALTKTTSVTYPNLTISESHLSDTPSKSPSRSFRDSPLKQVKNKLSSILKSSRGLLASSAAISAEGKSMLSPSPSRLAFHLAPSTESLISRPYSFSHGSDTRSMEEAPSPTKPVARRTRASTEREKEEKRREKEAQHMADQMDKLDRVREEEREKARVFSKEQEKIAAMEKQIVSKTQFERPAVKETPNPMRDSPKKTRVVDDGESKQADRDAEVGDALPAAQAASANKSAGPSQPARAKESKRPVKPTKEISIKAKQAPTVIRVNTSSQTSQYHPAGNRISTASHEVTGLSTSQMSTKASKATLQTKPSTQNLKALASVGRAKGLELTAKKKEQEEREAQRRREAKAEMDKKRAAVQEEQRRLDEEKKNAHRQAALEKAKQTRAPPPAVRSQPNGPPDATLLQQKTDSQPARPPSRVAPGMSVSAAAKTGAKRAFGPDTGDEGPGKRPPSRGGPSYQAKDAKRRRTSDAFDDLDAAQPPNIKGPPVRPSGGFKKDLQPKSVFQNGYGNAPHSATRDLFKATVTAQHNSHMKASHPLDMAQISKGPIPFAPNSNGAGSSFKTPARPGTYNGAKSTVKKATRSSPRFQNGETIELPEIQTDDEDEDDETQGMTVAAWADSPDLRRALMRQETMDPTQIFGQPGPLNMEEVFNKSKDKWHKFRQRTSSANWSGLDRLTEDDIRKDMAARDKMRRDGGWSYEMSKDMM
ncbi:Inner centromere protein-related protein pic1 [Cladobotryum mycophilum]|uniref:Inner centromere protein-related protein pic1 n=1 Tax=Cladobotryum mycophilum TaxID=491253 RepID=A0ABR0T295_9HYPO